MKFYLIIAAMIAGIVFSNQNPVLAWDKKYCDAHPNAGPPCPQPTPVPTPIPTPVSSPSEKNIQEQSQNQTQNTTNNNSNVNLNTAQGGTAYSYSAANAQGGAGGQGGNASTVNNVGNDQQSVNLVTAPLANPCSGAALSIGGTVARNSGLFNSNQYGVYGAVSIPIGKQHCNDSPPVTNITNNVPASVTNVTNNYSVPSTPVVITKVRKVYVNAPKVCLRYNTTENNLIKRYKYLVKHRLSHNRILELTNIREKLNQYCNQNYISKLLDGPGSLVL